MSTSKVWRLLLIFIAVIVITSGCKNDERKLKSLCKEICRQSTNHSKCTSNAAPKFCLGNSSSRLIIKEHKEVTFKCKTKGVGGQLSLLSGGRILKMVNASWYGHEKKHSSSRNHSKKLFYTIRRAECNDTGIYHCLSTKKHKIRISSVTLLVRCRPRLNTRTNSLLQIVMHSGSKAKLTFELLAFPPSKQLQVVRAEWTANVTAENGIILVKCEKRKYVFQAVSYCSVSVQNVQSSDAGFYVIRVENAVGVTNVTFQMTVKDESTSVPVVVAVIMSTTLVSTGIFAFLVWRTKCPGRKRPRRTPISVKSRPSTGSEHSDVTSLHAEENVTESSGVHESARVQLTEHAAIYTSIDFSHLSPLRTFPLPVVEPSVYAVIQNGKDTLCHQFK